MDQMRGDFTISRDKSRLDLDVIHGFLNTSYWAAGRSIETVQRSIENSIPFGLYKAELKIPERWIERHDPNTQEKPDYWGR